MSQMKKIVTTVSDILQDEAKREALFKLRGYHAQCLIDFLDYFVSDPEFLSTTEPWVLNPAVVALRRLCEASVLHPTRHVLSGIRDVSMKMVGGVCDIYKGRYDRQPLCLKVVRAHLKQDPDELLRVFVREATLWNQLDHPNIVPFYGIFNWYRKERVCFVSPWMKNNDIIQYLRKVPEAPRKLFIHDIINGLQYLHAANIVHGDLRGSKILIDDHQNASLADFGLSTIIMHERIHISVHWASPERFKENAPLTCESDVWAFGCVCYEVLTGRIPFMGCSDFTVVSKLMKGELPAPLDASTLDKNKSLNKKLRQLVKKCWSINPEQRPRCPEILREIENIPIIRQSCGPNRVTTRNSPGCPGFLLRTPGSTFSTNLNQGQKILEELYHGNDVAGVSDAIHSGPSDV